MNLDDRLRAAGNALREGSAAQVDAASSLREILLHADPVTDEPAGAPGPSPAPPAARLSGRPSGGWPWPSTCCWSWPSG